MKSKIIIIVLAVILVASIGVSVFSLVGGGVSGSVNENVTLVTTPDQDDYQEHSDFTLPEIIVTDFGTNIAIGKQVTEDGHNDVYVGRNATDGDEFTYWEGKVNAYPNSLTIDLGEVKTIDSARVVLNPKSIWGKRTQNVEVQVSTDGTTFTTAFPATDLDFDPATGNFNFFEFDAVDAQYVKVLFHSNTGAKGGQAGEIEIFEAQ